MLRGIVGAIILVFLCTGAALAQAPIAYNDTVTVVQFSSDTINIAAIDSSTSGDSLCLFKIYGSPNFTLINCSDIVYTPDTTFTGWDSCHYVICNAGDTLLCDTAVLVVDVTTYYRPFMLRNSKWVQYGEFDNCDNAYPYQFSIDYDSYVTGNMDTIINGKSYYPVYDVSSDTYVYYCNGDFEGAGHNIIPNLVGYLRQDTQARQVFILFPYLGHDSLLYDFNLQIGDSFQRNSNFSGIIYLAAIDSFQSGGAYYKRYYFSGSEGNDEWIEGIGSINGLFTTYENLFCFSHNDTAIYPNFNPDSTCANGNIISSVSTVQANPGPRIFPNPANNTVTITGIPPRTPIIIRNLLGQVLVNETSEGETQTLDISRLSAGMYFVNNMKLVKE